MRISNARLRELSASITAAMDRGANIDTTDKVMDRGPTLRELTAMIGEIKGWRGIDRLRASLDRNLKDDDTKPVL